MRIRIHDITALKIALDRKYDIYWEDYKIKPEGGIRKDLLESLSGSSPYNFNVLDDSFYMDISSHEYMTFLDKYENTNKE